MIDDRNVRLGFQPAGMTLLATIVSPESAEVKQKEKGVCNAKTDLILQTAPSTFKSSMGSHMLKLRVCLSSTGMQRPPILNWNLIVSKTCSQGYIGTSKTNT